MRIVRKIAGAVLILSLLMGCSAPIIAPTSIPPTIHVISTATSAPPAATPTPSPPPTSAHPTATVDGRGAEGLSDEEVATLSSLEQVDAHPLYTMTYYGPYEQVASSAEAVEWSGSPVHTTGIRGLQLASLETVRASTSDWARLNAAWVIPEMRTQRGLYRELVSADVLQAGWAASPPPTWGCSLFAALVDRRHMLYGRNFDWYYSPAVLLFTDPPDGYASISMVDIAYLFKSADAVALTGLPLAKRSALLQAPFMPFDGMNEYGLAVGMAAVPGSEMPYAPDRETIDSLMVIRQLLDHARKVDEAIALMESYNIDMGGGPPIHYLIADSSGHAALVEFYEGEMVVIPNEGPWHLATNFLRTTAGETGAGRCWRYDTIDERLTETRGRITVQDGMDLLADVSQPETQWSVLYDMSGGEIYVTMGRQYDRTHTFEFRDHPRNRIGRAPLTD